MAKFRRLDAAPDRTPHATVGFRFDAITREMLRAIQDYEARSTESDTLRSLIKRAYRALDLNGYARIDLRLDERGRAYVLEANPNPNLAYGEDFAESAEVYGLSYEKLLERIITLGLRWEPERTG